MALIFFVIIGGIAGWLMGMYLKEHGYGLYADIAIGVLGGIAGGWIFGAIGLSGWFGELIGAIIGSGALVWVVRAVQRAASQQTPVA
jgi:uncharacterized membrane protein YeaQ/YmgE (transglycosylase-associated protein family)